MKMLSAAIPLAILAALSALLLVRRKAKLEGVRVRR